LITDAFWKRGWSKSEILRNILPKMELLWNSFYISVRRQRERLLRRLEENTIGSSQWDLKERTMGWLHAVLRRSN
jgi:hypothetical protein